MAIKFKVVKDYQDAPDDPIRVTKGEVLDLVEESNPQGDWANWIYCRGENKQGWIPKQILAIENQQVTVTEDYFAKEYNLVIGELLIKEFELNGWIWSRKLGASDELAWAPLNHLCAV